LCGIFGILIGKKVDLSVQELVSLTKHLFKLSESRGKEASGIAIRVNHSLYIFKEPISSSELVKSDNYRKLFRSNIPNEGYIDGSLNTPFAILGHSRLQTNGLSEINSNNQPVVKDGAVGIHNGIIVNDEELWKSFPTLKRKYDVDTEVFLSILQMYRKQGSSIVDAVRNVFGQIDGSASVAVMFDDTNALLLATNTGSLYTKVSRNNEMLIFASEKYILEQIISDKCVRPLFDPNGISQIKARQGCLIDSDSMQKHPFSLKAIGTSSNLAVDENHHIRVVELYENNCSVNTPRIDSYLLKDSVRESMLQTWEDLYANGEKLKRCSKCLLPETMPFISFDAEGVCNYCRNYEERGSFLKGEKALEEFVAKYRKSSGESDCLVGFSGGRDSGYGLDYVQNRLDMHPIAFTYDWGMVNDLARRNQARICGRLGVEQIVVSADIKQKREYIHKNLKAWLRKPNLGMVPLLMAGDKQFYYYFHKIRKQTGIKLFIFCGGYEAEEGTGLFKYGFCNVNQGKSEALSRLTGISFTNKLKIMSYYLKQYITNPAYINNSILDTLFAYYSTYVIPDDYLYLFHYLDWNEDEILSKITKKFDWEKEDDTIATWRIDDGTAAFYNYIYMTMAGFTEFDIFRSHQIREGKLNRDKAYKLIVEENKPRFKSIEWYGQAIGFNMNKAIKKINLAQKLYSLS
jgi:glucosamine--fructose-6-phosphate aminotransferase (isomerizing)